MVEHNLAKVGVASSSLVSRSKSKRQLSRFFFIKGCVAEWSCSGLQSRVRRFDSGLSLHKAQVAKQVDARDLKSLGSNTMPVRFRPWAPIDYNKITGLSDRVSRLEGGIDRDLPAVAKISEKYDSFGFN